MERSALLDELLRAEGRQPHHVRRTIMKPVVCWRNVQELETRARHLRNAYTEIEGIAAIAEHVLPHFTA